MAISRPIVILIPGGYPHRLVSHSWCRKRMKAR